MGRGLSNLQRWVLEQAAGQAFVRHSDVMAGYYGIALTLRHPWRTAPQPRGLTYRGWLRLYSAEDQQRMGLSNFDVFTRAIMGTVERDYGNVHRLDSTTDPAAYKRAQAATSRTLARLLARGYLEPATRPYPGGPPIVASHNREEVPPGEDQIRSAYRITREGYQALGAQAPRLTTARGVRALS